jgi:hypothetical protein
MTLRALALILLLSAACKQENAACVDTGVRQPEVCPARYDGAFIPPRATARAIRGCTTTRKSGPSSVIEVTFAIGLDQHVCAYDGLSLALIQQTHCSDTGLYCGGHATCATDGEPLGLVCPEASSRDAAVDTGTTTPPVGGCVDPTIKLQSPCPARDSGGLPPGVDARVDSGCRQVGGSGIYDVVTYTLGLDVHVCVYESMSSQLVQQLRCTDTNRYCGNRSYCASDSPAIPLVCLPSSTPDGGAASLPDAASD